MNDVESITKQYEIGMKILIEIFKLTDAQLKEKLTSICGDKISSRNDSILKPRSDQGGTVIREIKDEHPSKIEIWCYDHIKISPWGIQYKPEHGTAENIVDFNEHFKL